MANNERGLAAMAPQSNVHVDDNNEEAIVNLEVDTMDKANA